MQQVVRFYLPSIHEISTLEKTKFYQRFILSSLMSKRLQQVNLFCDAAQFADAKGIGFHVWFSPNFLMQWKIARQESFSLHRDSFLNLGQEMTIVLLRISLHKKKNDWDICFVFLFIVSRYTGHVIAHCHEYNSSCDILWCLT